MIKKMLFFVRMFLILLLIVGSFLGFPNDALLAGYYWLLVGFVMLLELVRL